jgi:hypothetical protein
LGHPWKFIATTDFDSEDYKLTAHEIMSKMSGTVTYFSLDRNIKYQLKILEGNIIEDIASKNGIGPMSSPTCNKCHTADIEEVIVIGGPNTPPNPQTPLPGAGSFNPDNPQDLCVKAAAASAKATQQSKIPKFNIAKQGVLDALFSK